MIAALIRLDTAQVAWTDALAARFNLPLIDAPELAGARARDFERFLVERVGATFGFVFLTEGDGLRLHAFGDGFNLSIRADFHGPSVTYRRNKGGGRGQMIAKAVGLKHGSIPSVLDCTAGLGGDAFVLASLGCQVRMYERVPAVWALLQNGLLQARQQNDPELDAILNRMELVEADALWQMKTSDYRPDVVYLDPMFPARGKSALVKKEMRVFHHLVGQDADADALLQAALPVTRRRVVVKRPRIAPALEGPAPSHVLEGKSNRYDIYMLSDRQD